MPCQPCPHFSRVSRVRVNRVSLVGRVCVSVSASVPCQLCPCQPCRGSFYAVSVSTVLQESPCRSFCLAGSFQCPCLAVSVPRCGHPENVFALRHKIGHILTPIRSQRLRFWGSAAFFAIYRLSSTPALGRGLGNQTLRSLEPSNGLHRT